MNELDKIFDSKLDNNYAESILRGLTALGLTVDEELLNNLDQIPEDSFFVHLIKYFPQFKKPGKSEAAVASDIRQSLCDYVSSESINFLKYVDIY